MQFSVDMLSEYLVWKLQNYSDIFLLYKEQQTKQLFHIVPPSKNILPILLIKEANKKERIFEQKKKKKKNHFKILYFKHTAIFVLIIVKNLTQLEKKSLPTIQASILSI